jgi:hypothetical protein
MQPVIPTAREIRSTAELRSKMRRSVLAVAILCLYFISDAWAKNFAVPEQNPAATLVIPDSWKIEDIDYGYSAKSSDGDVFFSIEYAAGSRIDKMLDNNTDWMKENHIKAKAKPVENNIEIGGLSAKLLHYDASDENGDTMVDFVFISAGDGRVIMLTLWGSEEELKANQADIDTIKRSIKAIN